jgi:two-component system, LytTR family, sensor kinase
MKKGVRFWLIYAIVWLPYTVSYGTIFIQQGSSLPAAISDTLTNVLSAALLGLLVLWLCQRLPWSHYRRLWFFPLHACLAVVYAGLWVGAVSLVFTLRASIEKGTLTVLFLQSYALQWEFFSGLMIYATLVSVAYVLQISAHLREEERRLRETELRAARAETLQIRTELHGLRAKLNPHFLFNTLHTLMALVREDSAEAEAAIERFSSMLRYVLRRQSGAEEANATETTFADEWKFVENYLALERLRLGNRLNVVTEIDADVFDSLLPPFSLQPLIENAIKHGIAPRSQGGTISIAASLREGDLIVVVSDDGRGIAGRQVDASNGFGLQLIAKTLSAQYKGRAHFSIQTSPNQGFTVRLRIPQNAVERAPFGEVCAV